MTQAALAKAARLHRVSLVNIEQGKLLPTLRTLDRIAKALKVKPGDLLE